MSNRNKILHGGFIYGINDDYDPPPTNTVPPTLTDVLINDVLLNNEYIPDLTYPARIHLAKDLLELQEALLLKFEAKEIKFETFIFLMKKCNAILIKIR